MGLPAMTAACLGARACYTCCMCALSVRVCVCVPSAVMAAPEHATDREQFHLAGLIVRFMSELCARLGQRGVDASAAAVASDDTKKKLELARGTLRGVLQGLRRASHAAHDKSSELGAVLSDDGLKSVEELAIGVMKLADGLDLQRQAVLAQTAGGVGQEAARRVLATSQAAESSLSFARQELQRAHEHAKSAKPPADSVGLYGNQSALVALGAAELAQGHWSKARAALAQAIQASPEQCGAPVRVALGIALSRLNYPDLAAAAFQEALSHDPHSADAQVGLQTLRMARARTKDQDSFVQACTDAVAELNDLYMDNMTHAALLTRLAELKLLVPDMVLVGGQPLFATVQDHTRVLKLPVPVSEVPELRAGARLLLLQVKRHGAANLGEFQQLGRVVLTSVSGQAAFPAGEAGNSVTIDDSLHLHPQADGVVVKSFRCAEALALARSVEAHTHNTDLLAEAVYLQAKAQHALGKHVEAVALYRRVQTLRNMWAPALFGMAQALLSTGNLDKSKGLMQKVLELQPSNAEALSVLAQMALQKLAGLQRGRASIPVSGSGIKVEEYQKAIDAAMAKAKQLSKQAVALIPLDGKVWLTRGNVLVRSQTPNDQKLAAEAYYKAAICLKNAGLAPPWQLLYNIAVMQLRKVDDQPLAERGPLLSALSTADSMLSWASQGLSIALMPAGSRVEQDQLFTRKLLLLPACLPVLLAYARGRELRGEWALAFAIYRVVFIAWPTLPTAPLRLVRLLAQVGMRDAAMRVLDAMTGIHELPRASEGPSEEGVDAAGEAALAVLRDLVATSVDWPARVQAGMRTPGGVALPGRALVDGGVTLDSPVEAPTEFEDATSTRLAAWAMDPSIDQKVGAQLSAPILRQHLALAARRRCDVLVSVASARAVLIGLEAPERDARQSLLASAAKLQSFDREARVWAQAEYTERVLGTQFRLRRIAEGDAATYFDVRKQDASNKAKHFAKERHALLKDVFDDCKRLLKNKRTDVLLGNSFAAYLAEAGGLQHAREAFSICFSYNSRMCQSSVNVALVDLALGQHARADRALQRVLSRFFSVEDLATRNEAAMNSVKAADVTASADAEAGFALDLPAVAELQACFQARTAGPVPDDAAATLKQVADLALRPSIASCWPQPPAVADVVARLVDGSSVVPAVRPGGLWSSATSSLDLHQLPNLLFALTAARERGSAEFRSLVLDQECYKVTHAGSGAAVVNVQLLPFDFRAWLDLGRVLASSSLATMSAINAKLVRSGPGLLQLADVPDELVMSRAARDLSQATLYFMWCTEVLLQLYQSMLPDGDLVDFMLVDAALAEERAAPAEPERAAALAQLQLMARPGGPLDGLSLSKLMRTIQQMLQRVPAARKLQAKLAKAREALLPQLEAQRLAFEEAQKETAAAEAAAAEAAEQLRQQQQQVAMETSKLVAQRRAQWAAEYAQIKKKAGKGRRAAAVLDNRVELAAPVYDLPPEHAAALAAEVEQLLGNDSAVPDLDPAAASATVDSLFMVDGVDVTQLLTDLPGADLAAEFDLSALDSMPQLDALLASTDLQHDEAGPVVGQKRGRDE